MASRSASCLTIGTDLRQLYAISAGKIFWGAISQSVNGLKKVCHERPDGTFLAYSQACPREYLSSTPPVHWRVPFGRSWVKTE